jgi:hypothetical protein
LALGAVLLSAVTVTALALLATDDERAAARSASSSSHTFQPTPCPTDACDLPTPSPTPTFTPGPACPGEPSPPGGTCPPCPTWHPESADGAVVQSTCFPIASPTPWRSPTPCPTISPTNCDVVFPPIGDANCSFHVDVFDVRDLLRDFAGGETAPCRSYANAKCDDALSLRDVLFILHYAGLGSALVPAWCPPLGWQPGP